MQDYQEFLAVLRTEPIQWRRAESLVPTGVANALSTLESIGYLRRDDVFRLYDDYRCFQAARGEHTPDTDELRARIAGGTATIVDRALFLFTGTQDTKPDNT